LILFSSSAPPAKFVLKITGKDILQILVHRDSAGADWLPGADIECNQLPRVGLPKRTGKFYLRMIVDQEIRKTQVSPRGIEHKWTETFYL
jgi:hypothetical protein